MQIEFAQILVCTGKISSSSIECRVLKQLIAESNYDESFDKVLKIMLFAIVTFG